MPREKIPWRPYVETAKCNGCRECLTFCPKGVYAWVQESNHPEVVNPFQCVVGCSGCQTICPSGAISFPDLQEISRLITTLRWGKNEETY